MNASSWQAVWLLAVEVGAVVVLTLLIAWRLRSVVWQRTLWQASLIALIGLLVVEFSAVSFQKRGQAEMPMDAATLEVKDLTLQSTVSPVDVKGEAQVEYQAEQVVLPPMAEIAADVETTMVVAIPVATAAEVSFIETPKQTFPLALAIALGVWLVGSVVLAMRLLVGRLLLLRFCARSQTVFEVSLFDRVQGIARKLGLKQGVRVLETGRIQTPVVFGLIRLTIALPVGFAERFERRQQEAILAHELAHLAERDPLWYLLADALVSVLWWHPLVWVARARLQVASELAADEACVLAKHGPETLAECLVSIAKEMHGPGAMESIGIEGSGFRSRLGQRVERLLQLSAELVQRPSVWRTRLVKVGMPVLLLSLLVVGTGWMRQDGRAPWSGVVNGAWNTAVGAVRVEDEDIRRDPRPVLMVAVPAGANAVSGSTGNVERQYEAAVLLHAAKKLYGLGRLEEAEVKAKDAVKLSGSEESAAYLGYISELRRLEPKLREREQEVLAGANGKEVPVFRVIPIHEEALVKGLEKLTGTKPELLSVNGQDTANRTVGAWKQIVDATEDVISVRGVNIAKLEIGPEIMTYAGGQRLILLNIRGLPKDLDAAKNIVKEIHAAAGQEDKRGLSVDSKARTVMNTESLPAPIPYVRTNAPRTFTKSRQRLEAKLDSIVFKEVFFDGLPLSEVVRFLREESVSLDPEKKGVNFIINPHPVVPLGNQSKQELKDPLGNPLAPVAAQQDLNMVLVTISPPLKNFTMREMLNAITNVTADVGKHGLAYQVEDFAVVFRERVIEPPQLFTRIFKIDGDTFIQGLEKMTGKKVMPLTTNLVVNGGTNLLWKAVTTNNATVRTEQIQSMARQFFSEQGVNLQTNGMGRASPQMFFNDRTGTLFARVSLADFEIIREWVEKFSAAAEKDGTKEQSGNRAANAQQKEPAKTVAKFFKFDPDALVKGLEKLTGKSVDTMTEAALAGKAITNDGQDVTNRVTARVKQIFSLAEQYFASQGADMSKVSISPIFKIVPYELRGLMPTRASQADLEIIQQSLDKIMEAGKHVEVPVPAEKAPQELAPAPRSQPVKQQDDERITKVFKVDPDSAVNGFREMMKKSGFASTNLQEMMREFIFRAGVKLSADGTNGSVIFLNERTGVLLARAKPQEMQIIQSAIEVMNIIPPQVQIEAQYIEVPERVAEEMGLKWFANGLPPDESRPVEPGRMASINSNHFGIHIDSPKVPNHVSVLSPAQARELQARLDKASGINRLSAPRVTTANRRQAQISVVDVATVVVGRTNRLVKGEAGKQDTEEPVFITDQVAMGPVLDVIPSVFPDGKSMRLDWVFSLTEFFGYDKPEKKGELPEPQVRRRLVSNQNVIQDGYTLVAGCGMADVKTEGKKGLFNSGRSKTEKKMLLILMRVSLIDPAGNRVNRE